MARRHRSRRKNNRKRWGIKISCLAAGLLTVFLAVFLMGRVTAKQENQDHGTQETVDRTAGIGDKEREPSRLAVAGGGGRRRNSGKWNSRK